MVNIKKSTDKKCSASRSDAGQSVLLQQNLNGRVCQMRVVDELGDAAGEEAAR